MDFGTKKIVKLIHLMSRVFWSGLFKIFWLTMSWLISEKNSIYKVQKSYLKFLFFYFQRHSCHRTSYSWHLETGRKDRNYWLRQIPHVQSQRYACYTMHSGPENLRKSTQKNSSNHIPKSKIFFREIAFLAVFTFFLVQKLIFGHF